MCAAYFSCLHARPQMVDFGPCCETHPVFYNAYVDGGDSQPANGGARTNPPGARPVGSGATANGSARLHPAGARLAGSGATRAPSGGREWCTQEELDKWDEDQEAEMAPAPAPSGDRSDTRHRAVEPVGSGAELAGSAAEPVGGQRRRGSQSYKSWKRHREKVGGDSSDTAWHAWKAWVN